MLKAVAHKPFVLLGSGGTFKKKDLVEESEVIDGVSLKGILGPQSFLFLFLSP